MAFAALLWKLFQTSSLGAQLLLRNFDGRVADQEFLVRLPKLPCDGFDFPPMLSGLVEFPGDVDIASLLTIRLATRSRARLLRLRRKPESAN
jgi:hypothetical protein